SAARARPGDTAYSRSNRSRPSTVQPVHPAEERPLGRVGRDPAQCVTQRSIASGVRPSLECFREPTRARRQRNLAPQKNFFAKASFTQRLPPLSDRTIFGQVFVRGGMTAFLKMESPPTGRVKRAVTNSW